MRAPSELLAGPERPSFGGFVFVRTRQQQEAQTSMHHGLPQ